jgi:hypothetical protein
VFLKYPTGAFLVFLLHVSFCAPHVLLAAGLSRADDGPTQQAAWQSSGIQHAYGFPNAKKNEKGTLTASPDGLTFAAKSGRSILERRLILSASGGHQQVELWGVKGRLLRMAIPDGGGLAAAGVMHHRVDMLTVEFSDSNGGYHNAVFYMGSNEADRAIQSLALAPAAQHEIAESGCHGEVVKPGSVRVTAPDWDPVQVPAAYRALVYEHLVDRLERERGIGHVYRDGESDAGRGCPQYTLHISIAGFTQGSQVERAVMGPVGMFVGTTQMSFDATITDASGRLNDYKQVKTTVRGESESTNVADNIAKILASHYAAITKDFEKTGREDSKQAAYSR